MEYYLVHRYRDPFMKQRQSAIVAANADAASRAVAGHWDSDNNPQYRLLVSCKEDLLGSWENSIDLSPVRIAMRRPRVVFLSIIQSIVSFLPFGVVHEFTALSVRAMNTIAASCWCHAGSSRPGSSGSSSSSGRESQEIVGERSDHRVVPPISKQGSSRWIVEESS